MNAPFYVGQKVVAKTTSDCWKKGDGFIVLRIKKLSCCKWWGVDIGHGQITDCGDCGRNTNGSWFNSVCFSAIEETTYEDVRKELAVLPTDETPDVKKIKELV